MNRAKLGLAVRNLIGLCGTLKFLSVLIWRPEEFPFVYSVVFCSLVAVRAYLWSQKKWIYYLTDFCYVGNAVVLYFLWIQPHSPVLFKSGYIICCGLVGWSALLFHNGLIFHSIDQLTSTTLHIGPVLCVWLLRWTRFQVQPAGTDVWTVCSTHDCDSTVYDTVLVPAAIWAVWGLSYYVFTFHILRSWLERTGNESLFSYLVPNSGSGGPIGQLTTRLGLPESYRPLMFLSFFGALFVSTSIVAAACWSSYTLHTAVVCLQLLGSVWEGMLRYGAMADNNWNEITGYVPVVDSTK